MVRIRVGDKAPDFNLLDTDNKVRSLNEFLGQKSVLVFYIEAFTLESTKEL